MSAEVALADALFVARLAPHDPSAPFDDASRRLVVSFGRFMTECLVMDEDPSVRLRRLVLCWLVADTLRSRCGDLSLMKGVARCR